MTQQLELLRQTGCRRDPLPAASRRIPAARPGAALRPTGRYRGEPGKAKPLRPVQGHREGGDRGAYGKTAGRAGHAGRPLQPADGEVQGAGAAASRLFLRPAGRRQLPPAVEGDGLSHRVRQVQGVAHLGHRRQRIHRCHHGFRRQLPGAFSRFRDAGRGGADEAGGGNRPPVAHRRRSGPDDLRVHRDGPGHLLQHGLGSRHGGAFAWPAP